MTANLTTMPGQHKADTHIDLKRKPNEMAENDRERKRERERKKERTK